LKTKTDKIRIGFLFVGFLLFYLFCRKAALLRRAGKDRYGIANNDVQVRVQDSIP